MSKVVMVVDDSNATRKFISFALRSMGLTVHAAQDGLDALEQLARVPVDLVITDLNMPKLDGFGLVRALRGDRSYADVTVIILSSLSSDREQALGREIGADAYLVKPFDTKRIQYEVSKYIN